MDSSNEDQRLPHHMEPPQFVSLDELKKWGVLYWKVSLLKVMRNCTNIMLPFFSTALGAGRGVSARRVHFSVLVLGNGRVVFER